MNIPMQKDDLSGGRAQLPMSQNKLTGSNWCDVARTSALLLLVQKVAHNDIIFLCQHTPYL